VTVGDVKAILGLVDCILGDSRDVCTGVIDNNRAYSRSNQKAREQKNQEKTRYEKG
jgi:hypothetical protein